MAKQTFTTGQVLTAAEMTTLQTNDYNQTVTAKTANYVLVAADAGTRITMSNAGATTITVNTSLFAAGDTLFITNIGAGACTITAGTATVSTASSLVLAQYDSGRLYFTSTGVAIWEKYQGASVATAQNFVLLSTSTLSTGGVSTFTVSSLSGYNQLCIVINGASTTSANPVYTLRLNTDATSKYMNVGMLTTTAPAISGYKVENLNDATYFSLGTGDGSAAGYMMGMVVISGANSSGVKLVQIQTVTSATATGYPIIEQGVYTGSSVVSSVSLISSAGTFDGGTMYIYGAA